MDESIVGHCDGLGDGGFSGGLFGGLISGFRWVLVMWVSM